MPLWCAHLGHRPRGHPRHPVDREHLPGALRAYLWRVHAQRRCVHRAVHRAQVVRRWRLLVAGHARGGPRLPRHRHRVHRGRHHLWPGLSLHAPQAAGPLCPPPLGGDDPPHLRGLRVLRGERGPGALGHHCPSRGGHLPALLHFLLALLRGAARVAPRAHPPRGQVGAVHLPLPRHQHLPHLRRRWPPRLLFRAQGVGHGAHRLLHLHRRPRDHLAAHHGHSHVHPRQHWAQAQETHVRRHDAHVVGGPARGHGICPSQGPRQPGDREPHHVGGALDHVCAGVLHRTARAQARPRAC
mmetsp:Transcript_364/g.939  ORF Transcript_364/g.939 Transcript_364/m.939 type:complete len:298 (+) Transcript_364:450-1343(+)